MALGMWCHRVKLLAMVNQAAGLRGDSATNDGTRRYHEPWSRTKSLVFLVGMLLTEAALTLGGIHVVTLTIVWR